MHSGDDKVERNETVFSLKASTDQNDWVEASNQGGIVKNKDLLMGQKEVDICANSALLVTQSGGYNVFKKFAKADSDHSLISRASLNSTRLF